VSVRKRRRREIGHFDEDPGAGPLLEVEDLHTHFPTPRGVARVVDGVSFTLDRGRTLGIVGESGSGKTILSRSVINLLPKNAIRSGSVKLMGREISTLSDRDMRDVWGTEMAMVFQDPMTSLNPVKRVGTQITEGLTYHLGDKGKVAEETAVALMRSVRIPEPDRRLKEYPHQLSGGMRQRVSIAVALACGPRLLIADEPTTALDVTVQAQILDLLANQQRERFMAMMLITHDLGVVAGRTDEIAVMYAGRIVERAPVHDIYKAPAHPYTRGLLDSIPRLDQKGQELYAIKGLPPNLMNIPPGCAFNPRCPMAQDVCRTDVPPLYEVNGEDSGRRSACHFWRECLDG
jgi:oligopeptide transport system ATP-binding protein